MNPVAQLYIEKARVLYVGPSFDAVIHSHHAVQFALGIDASLEFSEAGDDWQPCETVLIKSDVRHAVKCGEGLVAMLYVEPESIQSIQEANSNNVRLDMGRHGQAISRDILKNLRENLRLAHSSKELAALCDDVCSEFGFSIQSNPILDPRIRDTLLRIDLAEGESTSLRELAEHANLSESRLSHLFREQTGMALRRYILWRRLRTAVEFASRGATLTEAAAHAGFSDAPHFSRTYKGMFGITPSFLFGNRGQLQIHIERG